MPVPVPYDRKHPYDDGEERRTPDEYPEKRDIIPTWVVDKYKHCVPEGTPFGKKVII